MADPITRDVVHKEAVVLRGKRGLTLSASPVSASSWLNLAFLSVWWLHFRLYHAC